MAILYHQRSAAGSTMIAVILSPLRRLRHAESRGQRAALPDRAGDADGRRDAPVLGPRSTLERIARPGRRAAASPAARREPHRLPRDIRRRGIDRQPVPAPGYEPLLRPVTPCSCTWAPWTPTRSRPERGRATRWPIGRRVTR